MAITTNHTTETITPENGILTIGTDGAIKLPIGSIVNRPAGIKGLVRFTDDTLDPEYHDGIDWQVISNKSYVDSAKQTLQEQIDFIVSNVDPAALDSLAEIVKAFQDADIDIVTAITTLTDSIATEVQNRINGNNNLQSLIDAEQLRATAAEVELQNAIVQEGNRAQVVENTLFDDIDAEAAARIAGDSSLDTRITSVEDQIDNISFNGDVIVGSLTSLTTDDKTSIVNAINEVDANIDMFGANLDTALSNLSLDDLSDVTITTPTDGQVLVYDVATGQFRTQTQALNVITRTYTADGVTYDFDMNTSVSSIHNIVVTINGIQQEPFYSFVLTNNTIITFDEAPEFGDKIQIKILTTSAQTDRPRPRVTDINYGTVGIYTTFTITATDVTYGTSVKIGDRACTRIDYINSNQMQVMIPTTLMSDIFWDTSRDLTLIDTSGNEFVYKNMIYYGSGKPQFTNSNNYIGSFSGGDSINFEILVNNSTSITISPAYSGDAAISWLSISGTSIVGTAPINSSPSRYEIAITASNGIVDITKNYWLLVV